MKVACFAGYSNSGKTTLIEQIIPLLRQQGLRVSVVKHAHHQFDIDHPGKDTWRHREAGAFEVVAASSQRLVLMREYERNAEPQVHHLIAELYEGVDWVLVEGFKDSELLKVEIWRSANGKAARYPHDPFITAIATDSPNALPEPTLRPVLDLNRADDVAAWLVENGERFEYDPAIYQ